MQFPATQFLLLAAVILLAPHAFAQSSARTGNEKLPLSPLEQPIPFSHKLHVGFGTKCRDCHAIKRPGFAAGYPASDFCMLCHAGVKTESPAVQKIARSQESNTPIAWVKVYDLPDNIWFSHQTHAVDAKLACEQCHGLVAEREVLFKEKPTSMASCMACHAERRVSNACDLCHDAP